MADEVAKRYEPTPQERVAIDAYFERKNDAVACPNLKVTPNEDGIAQIAIDHVEPGLAWTVLTQALGATDPNFAPVLASQLANAVGKDLSPTQGLNFMLAVVKSVEPRNELESLLATQMAAVHTATMLMACRLASSTRLKQQESAERALNKLARTFAMQLETLKRYRTGGEQKVTVEHVHVHPGGQAIVGTVSTWWG
jgi:hypothetical protein